MVTILRKIVYDQWNHDVRCLSTDTKPTENIANGSELLEMDTGKVYVFDRDNMTWIKL
jgi:hypothetical protein